MHYAYINIHLICETMYTCLYNNYNTYIHIIFVGEQEIYLFKNTTLNYTTLNCSLEENEHHKNYKVG